MRIKEVKRREKKVRGRKFGGDERPSMYQKDGTIGYLRTICNVYVYVCSS